MPQGLDQVGEMNPSPREHQTPLRLEELSLCFNAAHLAAPELGLGAVLLYRDEKA
jgi:hypothetical protein